MSGPHFVYLFLKLNVWLCLTSVLMVVASALVVGIQPSTVGVGLLLPPLLFYFIYVEDRRSVDSEDRINEPYRTELIEQYRRGLLGTELAALGAYELLVLRFVLTTDVAMVFLLLAQLPLAVLAVYSRLKRYPTFDSVAVGGTWAFVIVFTVMVSTGAPLSAELGLVFLGWFLIVFAGAESRNLQDIDGDVATGKTTLAGYLGERRTKAMEGILKTAGVALFWHLAGTVVAVVVVVYLLLLRLFRGLTAHSAERPAISSTSD